MVNKVAQSSTAFKWEVQNQELLQEQLSNLIKKTQDLRIPFRLIAADFYRSQRKIFTLKGSGLYQDLAPATGIHGNPTTTSNYKERKRKKLGFCYPILRGATRNLEKSTTTKNATYSVFILGRLSLTIGTRVPYGIYHQSDEPRTKIPQRKFIFIDGGPDDKALDGVNGRRERWTKILENYLDQLTTGILA